MRLPQILLLVIEAMWFVILYFVAPNAITYLLAVISFVLGLTVMWTIALDHFILSKEKAA